MNTDLTTTASLDYLIEITDDGNQADAPPLEAEVIVLPHPRKGQQSSAPEQRPQA